MEERVRPRVNPAEIDFADLKQHRDGFAVAQMEDVQRQKSQVFPPELMPLAVRAYRVSE